MTERISVSKAARLAGVSRGTIQRAIRKGTFATFEGEVLVSDLRRIYPHVSLEDESVIERMTRIQEQAMHKATRATRPSDRDLLADVNRLRLELQDARDEVRHYEALVMELKQRLTRMQNDDQCTRKQKLVIQALVSWMLANLEHRAY